MCEGLKRYKLAFPNSCPSRKHNLENETEEATNISKIRPRVRRDVGVTGAKKGGRNGSGDEGGFKMEETTELCLER